MLTSIHLAPPGMALRFPLFCWKRLFFLLLGSILFNFPTTISAQNSCSITGPTPICIEALSVYNISVSTNQPSYSVVWNTSPGGVGAIMQQNNSMATIHWEGAGSATVTARVLGPTGTTLSICDLPVTVLPEPHPRIVPEYLPQANCITIPGGERPMLITGYCANTVIVLHADGNDGPYQWTVSGNAAIQGSSTGSDLTVETGSMGTFEVTLTETNAAGCSSEVAEKYSVFDPPTATASELTHLNSTAFSVCKGEDLLFLGEATDPNGFKTDNWNWSVMNGTGTLAWGNQQNFAYTFSQPGVYTVNLYVTNCLGCPSATVSLEVTVTNADRPEIVCPSVVCESATPVRYCAVPTCGSYNWTVSGGTPTTGTAQCHEVVWNSVPQSGYGSIMLTVANCQGNLCNLPTAVEVPIIPANLTISGPSAVCAASTQVSYSLPYWPGANYSWSVDPVAGSTGTAVLFSASGNSATVSLTNFSGSFTVKAKVEHPVAGCISNGSLTVAAYSYRIVPAPLTLCYGLPADLSVQPTPPGSDYKIRWRVFGSTASPIVVDASPDVTIPFNDFGGSGTFLVFAEIMLNNGQSITCDELHTTVIYQKKVEDITEVIGPRNICANQTYTYTASPPQPPEIQWTVTGGTPNPATGSSINIHWGSGPGYKISVVRESATSHCKSTPYVVDDVVEAGGTVDATFTGPTTVCADGTSMYTANDLTGTEYTWKILDHPNYGSIVMGQGTPQVTILWHQPSSSPSSSVRVELTIKKCGAQDVETLTVQVKQPSFQLSCPGLPQGNECKVCQHELLNIFATTLAGATYTWTVDDNPVPNQTTTLLNWTFDEPGTHFIRVSATGAANCPGTFSDVLALNVVANPDPIIAPSDLVLCNDPQPITLYTTTYAGADDEKFSWQTPQGWPSSPGNLSSLYLPIDAGTADKYYGIYTVYIQRTIDGLTCHAEATYDLECTPAGPPDGPPNDVVFTSWEFKGDIDCNTCAINGIPNECGHVVVHGSIGSHDFGEVENAQWVVYDPSNGLDPVDIFPINGPSGVEATEISTFHRAGLYPTELQVQFFGASLAVVDRKIIEIPIVPDFSWSLECCTKDNGEEGYRLHLLDISARAVGNPINNRRWFFSANGGAATTVDVPTALYVTDCIFDAGDEVSVCLRPETETVIGQPVDSRYACTRCQVIEMPDVAAHLEISAEQLTACKGAPVHFHSIVDPGGQHVLSYDWSFGDNSGSALPDPVKYYSNTGTWFVTLTVKLANGCSLSGNLLINVVNNNMTGSIVEMQTGCNDVMGLEVMTTPAAISWNWAPNGEITPAITVPGTGVYSVTATDARGCTFSATQEVATEEPFADAIMGDMSGCLKDTFDFRIISGGNNYTYTWTSDYPGYAGANGTSTSIIGLIPGYYHVTVTAYRNGSTCGMLSADFSIHVIPLAPTYDLTYTCDPFSAMIRTDPTQQVGWLSPQNQFLGYLTEITTTRGGKYKLTTTNTYGCTAQNTVEVAEPILLSTLSGCYEECDTMLKDCRLYIPAPPGSYTSWEWVLVNPPSPETILLQNTGSPSPIEKLCLLPSMAGTIVLRVHQHYANANFDPGTGTTGSTTISCDEESDPFCLTVKECKPCPDLTATLTLSQLQCAMGASGLDEQILMVTGTLHLPAGYPPCDNVLHLTGGYFTYATGFPQYVGPPFNQIKIQGFLHVTDLNDYHDGGLDGYVLLCDPATGESCPANFNVRYEACNESIWCMLTKTLTYNYSAQPYPTVKMTITFPAHYVNGDPCDITSYTATIWKSDGTSTTTLVQQTFNGQPPSDAMHSVSYTIYMKDINTFGCVNFSYISNCGLGCECYGLCFNTGEGSNGSCSPVEMRSEPDSGAKASFVMKPNPANNTVLLDYSLPGGSVEGSINVLNSLGQLIVRVYLYNREGSTLMEAEDWPPGIYFLSLTSGGQTTEMKKLVIQR